MKKSVFWIFTGLMALGSGCQKQAQVEETLPICIEAASMDQVFSSAESVLTGMQFQIEKADRQAGQIITRPLRGGQFFEVWRQDNATAFNTAESNLHSLQRTAEVRFGRMDNEICVNCRVLVRRLSIPDEPIQGMGRASGLFTDGSRREQRLQMSQETVEEAEWSYLDRDQALEEVILRKIEKAVRRGGQ